MLMKLTTCVTFINIFTYSFYTHRSLTCKKRLSSQHCHFALLGSVSVKVVCRTLMKSNPGVNFTSILWAHFLYVPTVSLVLGFLIFFEEGILVKNCLLNVASISPTFYDQLFCRFGQAKFAYGGKVLGSSRFSIQTLLPQKMKLVFTCQKKHNFIRKGCS